MYRINNIPISNYQMVPGQAPDSNIALSGHLDLNKRKGKTYHDWGEEEGVEPYVSEQDLEQGYEPITITFYGIIKGKDRPEVVKRASELFEDLSAVEASGEYGYFESPWGAWAVKSGGKIESEWLGPSAVSIKMPMLRMSTLPNLLTDNPRNDSSTGLHHIENKKLADYGAFVESVDDNFDRPAPKEDTSSYYEEGWEQVTLPGYKEFSFSMMFTAPTYDEMAGAVLNFYGKLMQPGSRTINVDGYERECFNIDGAKVDAIKVFDHLAVCRMKLTMALAYDGTPKEGRYLHDNDDVNITSNTGKYISIQEKNVVELTDRYGRPIYTDDYEQITI